MTRLSIVGPQACGAFHTESCLPKQLTALRFRTSLNTGHDLIRPLELLRELDISMLDCNLVWRGPTSWSLDKVKLRTSNSSKLGYLAL